MINNTGSYARKMKEKIPTLINIYNRFEAKTLEYKKDAACEKGCAYCCKEAGKIDITTFEGLIIRKTMRGFARSRQKSLTKLFQQEIRKRGKKVMAPCPFFRNTKHIFEKPFMNKIIFQFEKQTLCLPLEGENPIKDFYSYEALKLVFG